MPTFTFNNQSGGSSYVVLDPEFGINLIPSTTPKYFSSVTFSNFSNISRDDIVVNDYKLGIAVPEGNSSFEFTPSTSVPISDVIIRGAGDCSVVYQDGATTINITAEELNNPTGNPTPPPPPPSYNNQFSFFFNQTGSFTLKQRFQTAVNIGLSPTNNFTVSVWAKPYIADPPDDGTLFDNANSSNGFLLMHDDIGSGAWNFQIQKSGQIKRVRSSTIPSANTWQHVLGVFSNGTGSIFVNGVKRGEDNFTGETEVGINNTQGPMIGTAQGQTIGTIDPYSGSLQNVSLWGVAFNQTEIDEIYNGGTPTDLNTHSRVADGIAWWQIGGNGESGSYTAPPPIQKWTELNCFDNASYAMTSVNMGFPSRVTDTP